MTRQQLIDRYGPELTGLVTRIWYAKDAGAAETGMRLRAANNRIDEILGEVIDHCLGTAKPPPAPPPPPPPPPKTTTPPTPPRAPSPLSGPPSGPPPK